MTEPCDRFEREGLSGWEQGAALDPHFGSCPACAAQRRAYDRIAEELTQARDAVPPPGWEDRVFAELEARRRLQRGPHRLGKLAAAAAVLLCAVGGSLYWRSGDGAPTPLRLSVEVRADGAAALRGASARPGDLLAFTAQVPAGEISEVRVWRENGELVLRCPGSVPAGAKCTRDGASLSAELRLPAVGRYQSFVVSSSSALPAPLPRFGDDAAQLMEAKARVEMAEPVDVY